MLHELIDREDPKCLYCNSNTEFNSDSISSSHGTTYNKETITCCACKEIFEILSTQNLEGVTSYTAFHFSCNGIFVLNYYDIDVFYFSTKSFVSKNWEEIPKFEVSFFDKNKLYEKLKTYLLFS